MKTARLRNQSATLHTHRPLRPHEDLILSVLPVACYTADPSTLHERPWISQNAGQVTGFSPHVFSANRRLWSSRIHRYDRKRVLSEFLTLTDGETCAVEYRWKVADGSWRWFLDTAICAIDKNLNRRRIIGLLIDITKRKTSERAPESSRLEVEQNREELRTLAGKLLSVQDEERRRIARDLHDDVNQRLAVLGLDLESIAQSLPPSSVNIRRRLLALQEQVMTLTSDIRHLAYQFHQTIVEDLGLVVALQRYLNDFTRRTGVNARFIKRNLRDAIPLAVASCLYRVAQESLGNVAAHSRATQVTVELTGGATDMTLIVRDDGAGMDVDDVRRQSRGLGILSMRERLRLLGGSLEIHSQPGHGTAVHARAPRGDFPS